MNWSAVDSGRSDCLLDCLREVRLEQFAGNFATRGITDCAKLAALDRQQFATYDITSPADIRRLTRLITVIRDLRADGLICGHGALSKPAVEKADLLSVPCDLWQQTSKPTSVQRSQKKHLVDRRAAADDTTNNTSTWLNATDARSYRRSSRESQRCCRGMKRAATTSGGRHSVDVQTQYHDQTSFVPHCERIVSQLPTRVEKVI